MASKAQLDAKDSFNANVASITWSDGEITALNDFLERLASAPYSPVIAALTTLDPEGRLQLEFIPGMVLNWKLRRSKNSGPIELLDVENITIELLAVRRIRRSK